MKKCQHCSEDIQDAARTCRHCGSNAMVADPNYAEKDVAYYAACVQASVDTLMERDRSLLTLSAGGIGLLVTLLTTVGATSICHLLLYAAATLAFLVSIISALAIFSRNSTRMAQIVKGVDTPDMMLRVLDGVLLSSFVFGVILTL